MRDNCMARLAACISNLETAKDMAMEALSIFVDPDEDKKGEIRSELLEALDESIGLAAIACQKAQGLMEKVDFSEGEEEEEEADGDEEED